MRVCHPLPADLNAFITSSPANYARKPHRYLPSRLRSRIEAMGGELDIIARFPGGAIKISNLTELG